MLYNECVRGESGPSMKVPPKRKGNEPIRRAKITFRALNESPSEKEGKSGGRAGENFRGKTLNESPSEKEGKSGGRAGENFRGKTLNESPSEKEGKWRSHRCGRLALAVPSMKVPPKRKGNQT